MKENPVRWFEIYVQDAKRAQRFYERVLGLELQPLEEDVSPEIETMLMFPADQNASGATGALVKMRGVPSGGHGTIVYFGCADCSIEANRARDAGGKIFKDKFSIGRHGFIALITDPDGNVVGLHSMT